MSTGSAVCLPILAVLLATSGISAAASPDDSNLRLGKFLERHERLDEAEAAYRKAVESNSSAVSEEAFAGLDRIARMRNDLWHRLTSSCEDLVNGAIAPALLVAGSIVGGGLLYGAIRLGRRLGWLGRNRLEVLPLTVADKEWNGEHFSAVVGALIERMRPRPGFLIDDSKLPFLVPEWEKDGGSVATVLVPGQASLVLDRIVRLFRVPEYSLRGSLHLDETTAHLVVRLERFGVPVAGWDRTCPVAKALEELKDTAYLSLAAIRQGKGRPDEY